MTEAIRLIVGLGNPGAKYEATRHNAGFWMLDLLAEDFHADFKLEHNFFGEVAKFRRGGETIYLLKPATYMNLSGKAVQALSHFYKIPVQSMLVVHDELDLMPGQIKLKRGGGHAGHNGLRDIQSKLGSNDYWRLRVGIGHPRSLNLSQGVADFVLHMPSKADHEHIVACLYRARQAIPALLDGDRDRANRLLAEPKA
ncbi:Peptidyl-tRNA hydrolase [Oligella urethralis]|uniref:aminoacyl-tRNA hydrolase n=1 Tax=Oligella urethralis TaxID=90245 RepID=UPI000C9A273E|nr:aminoacyl-tRNA hydrolase [Oligella urethralis]PMC17367.1 aminoacyl-tRNA hydrolase [Oligella urethralis]WOS38330.1 Peptidyl-tRNA hydrolase [Oligella urethralis]SUA66128.1 Peptidyl-tRNA hydrolase [Oligella urethralis]